jgi:hypothetical protein
MTLSIQALICGSIKADRAIGERRGFRLTISGMACGSRSNRVLWLSVSRVARRFRLVGPAFTRPLRLLRVQPG